MGEIIGVHGVRGGLTIRSFTDPLENVLHYSRWQLDERREVRVIEGGWSGKRMVVHLEEHGTPITDRDQAAALIGARICVPRTALPESDELIGPTWLDCRSRPLTANLSERSSICWKPEPTTSWWFAVTGSG